MGEGTAARALAPATDLDPYSNPNLRHEVPRLKALLQMAMHRRPRPRGSVPSLEQAILKQRAAIDG